MRDAARALVLAALLVLAGCNTPFGTGPATTADSTDNETGESAATPRPGGDSLDPGEQVVYAEQRPTPTEIEPEDPPAPEEVPVSGDELPVDAGRVFARVEGLVDTEAEPPEVDINSGFGGDGGYGRTQEDPFEAMLGIGPPQAVSESEGAVQVGGATFPDGSVTLTSREGEPGDFERTLAHEYAHVVQFDLGAMEWIRDGIPAPREATSDGQLTEDSIVEGGATYLATQYGIRYQHGFNTERTQILRIYRNASAGTRLLWAPYLYGSLYIRERIDSPELLWTVYRLPPETTEQVLHGGSDQPAELTVVSRNSGSDADWEVSQRDSRGELFTRIALRTELDAERAAHAATGWGNDRVLVYEQDYDEHAFVWTLRWDDAANATEFEDAFRSYLASRGQFEDGRWTVGADEFRLVDVDDRTVAVVAGPAGFVSGTEVRQRGDTIEVTPPADSTDTETPSGDPTGDDPSDDGDGVGDDGDGVGDDGAGDDGEGDGAGADDDGDGITDPFLPG